MRSLLTAPSLSLEEALNHGKQIRLFLTDGTASGIRYAELMNWTGQAFSCPKSSFAKLKEWPETQRPGVYVLVGLNTSGDETVYIGESENVAHRLLSHVSQSTLDEIVEAFFFTSKDDNLTKGHITFLEERLAKRAREAKQYSVQFGREPSAKTLSKPESATMEEFIENLYLVAAAMGYRVFEVPSVERPAPDATGLFRLELENSVLATGYPSEGGFVVKAGSFARDTDAESLQVGYKAQKNELKKKGILVIDGTRLRFNEDYEFSSSSAAAGIVSGSQRSGPQSWVRSDGKRLREVEAEKAQVEEQQLVVPAASDTTQGVIDA